MCCPASCGCKFNLEETSGTCQEHIPLQSPITTQPGRKIGVEMKLGNPELLEKIKMAGQMLASVVNAAGTQRGAGYCKEHCGPWCDSHCPNWLSHCFQCLCTCIINPSDSQSANQDLSLFLTDMKNTHGPIVLGMGMQQGGLDFLSLMSEGKTLNEDQKNNFNRQCSEIKNSLKKLLKDSLQQELFNTVNNPEKLPKISDNDTIMAKSAYDDVTSGVYHTPPSIWIIYDNNGNSRDDSRGAAGGTSKLNYTKRLDWDKLRHQLNHLCVLQLDNDDNFPLGGKEGKKAVKILQNTFYYLTRRASCFKTGEEGFGLTITSEKLLNLILLSLLSLGFAPTNKEGSAPTATLPNLITLSEFLQEGRNPNEHPESEDPDNHEGDTEVDGHLQSSSSSSMKENEEWFSNEHQNTLLCLSEQVNSLAGILG
ncbi:hypothetical protein C834K_0320 [Chlamydia poikilotherma]|uniref:Uncharacterized protein n=1 Tax=Chlamydia poikilotherma TaxID=1967783 RepID=A0A3B0PZC9_9CHLA|nr:hypothetical protein [Chlamydia poikilotherma]SYX08785.1 hypothetical protein C834K_0320 [Chlamydia poikilotherma]